MVQTIEIYRQFLLTGLGPEARLVYAEAAPTTAPTVEAQPGEEAVGEQQEEIDVSGQTELARENIQKQIQDLINKMGEGEENAEGKQALQELLTQLQRHSEQEFAALQSEYETLADEIENKNDIDRTQANSLIEKIKTRESLPQARTALTDQLFANRNFKDAIAKLTNSKKPGDRMALEDFRNAMKDEKIQKALNSFLTSDRITEITSGNFQLEGELATGLASSFMEEYFPGREGTAEIGTLASRAEIEMLRGAEIQIEGGGKIKLSDLGDEFIGLLSMQHEIKQGDKGEILVGTQKLSEMKLDDLKKGLNEETQKALMAYIQGLEGNDKENLLKAFQDTAKSELLTRANMNKIQQALNNPDGIEGLRKMGGLETLTTIIKFLPLLKQAYEEMDFQSIGDLMKDITTNPQLIDAKIQQATKAYEKGIEGAKLQQLLAMYHEPYGSEASARMGEGTPYRILLKEPVTQKIMEETGISNINKIEGNANLTRITTMEGDRTRVITIENGSIKESAVAAAEPAAVAEPAKEEPE